MHKTSKEEFTNDRQINLCNIEQAKSEIKKFIGFYNRQRPHRKTDESIFSNGLGLYILWVGLLIFCNFGFER